MFLKVQRLSIVLISSGFLSQENPAPPPLYVMATSLTFISRKKAKFFISAESSISQIWLGLFHKMSISRKTHFRLILENEFYHEIKWKTSFMDSMSSASRSVWLQAFLLSIKNKVEAKRFLYWVFTYCSKYAPSPF